MLLQSFDVNSKSSEVFNRCKCTLEFSGYRLRWMLSFWVSRGRPKGIGKPLGCRCGRFKWTVRPWVCSCNVDCGCVNADREEGVLISLKSERKEGVAVSLESERADAHLGVCGLISMHLQLRDIFAPTYLQLKQDQYSGRF